jgi:hypothetical protein
MTGGASSFSEYSKVTVVEPERMNLLGLMLRSVIERRLASPFTARATRFLRGDVVIDASGMRVTLRFGGDKVVITREPPAGKPVVEIRGTLVGLLDAALQRNRVRHFLRRELEPRGRPLQLLSLLLLLGA